MRADAPQMPVHETEVLGAAQGAQRLPLVHRPLTAHSVQIANPVLNHVYQAPKFTEIWAEMCDHLPGVVHARKLVGDQVLIIGDTVVERGWLVASKAAGYLESARYFRAGA
jgi:hypothetical protein